MIGHTAASEIAGISSLPGYSRSQLLFPAAGASAINCLKETYGPWSLWLKSATLSALARTKRKGRSHNSSVSQDAETDHRDPSIPPDCTPQGRHISEDQEEWHRDKIQDPVQQVLVHLGDEGQGQSRKTQAVIATVASEERDLRVFGACTSKG